MFSACRGSCELTRLVGTTAPSLDPRSLDPNRRDLGEEVKGFFRTVFKKGPEAPNQSPYRSASNVPGGLQMGTGYSTYAGFERSPAEEAPAAPSG